MEGNQVGTITNYSAGKKPSFFDKKSLLKGGASLLGGLAAAGIGAAMGAPAAAGALYGVKGARAGRNLLSKGTSLFKKMNPSAKPMKVKQPKSTQIKTAKPAMVKPKKVEVSPEEKMQVMSWYDVGGFKPRTSLAPKPNATLAPEKIRGASKRKATMAGRKIDAKKAGAPVYDYPGLIKRDLERDNALKLFR